jgi:hypothetical protein
MSKIRITSEQARRFPPVGSKEESHLASLLKLHVLSIVEDAFISYKGSERMTPIIEKEWNKLKRILEKKL